jgi:hypothetical protein
MPALNKPYQHRGCLASGKQIRSDADDDWGTRSRTRRKLRTTISKWLGLKSEAHDRQAQELPAQARIATMEVDDPNPTSGETERIVVARTISADRWLGCMLTSISTMPSTWLAGAGKGSMTGQR